MKKESELDEGSGNERTNWRHFLIICSVLISAYLLNGDHAPTVCNICTTVPAAIFTYGQLSDHATRIFAYVRFLLKHSDSDSYVRYEKRKLLYVQMSRTCYYDIR